MSNRGDVVRISALGISAFCISLRLFMDYFKPVRCSDDSVLSIDNIRVSFIIESQYSNELMSYLSFGVQWYSYPQNMSDFKYRYLMKATYGNGSTMTLGFCFNGVDKLEDSKKGFVDFNPNKTGNESLFWEDLCKIRSCCKYWIIERIDIAHDIPIKRECVYMVKDNRKYALDAYSLSNMTEYLGIRSNPNFVKVYNKTLESKLDYDLTRIEVTTKPSVSAFMSAYPEVYALYDLQLDMSTAALTQSNLAILQMELALLANHKDPGLMLFNQLGKDLKKKLKPFLLPESSLLVVRSEHIYTLFYEVLPLFTKV